LPHNLSEMNLSKRQLEIIEASLAIIDQGGIQSLTIKNISKKVGISEPAIYRHFDSKTDILLTILDFFIVNNNRIIQQDLMENDDVKVVITKLFDKFTKTFLEYPALTSIIFSEEIFRNDPVFREKSNLILNGSFEMITKLVEKGKATKQIKKELDAASLATMIMGSLRLCIKRWQMSDYGFNLPEQTQKLRDTILKVILK